MVTRKIIIILITCFILSGCSGIHMKPKNRICPEPIKPTETERLFLRTNIPDFYIRYSEQQRKLYICRYGKDPVR